MKTIPLALALVAVAAGCAVPRPAMTLAPAPSGERPIFSFRQDADLDRWEVQNAASLFRHSNAALALNEAGNAVFSGIAPAKSDAGAPAVRYACGPVDVSTCGAVALGLQGDGRRYQLRVGARADELHSYACDFPTSGDWQTVEIPFADLRTLRDGAAPPNAPPYPGRQLAWIQILAPPGTPGSFRLEIDKIWLK